MAQGQTKGKYWLANNPNAGITNDEVTALGAQTETELDLLDGASAGSAVASKAVIYDAYQGIELGNTSQAAGVFTAKVSTGILNHQTVFTTPAPAASVATGTHTLTAANLANGFIVQTSNHVSTSTTVMPAKAVMVTLFGDQAEVGDSFIWYLHNAATTVNLNLIWTAATGATLVGQAGVAANVADNETATNGGTSTAQFMTRLTATDGTTVTYRLS